ncbi:hypothetical protein DMN91_009999 [Ooceraea biroi]|uniref:Cell growth-regulating nucleolar protein n=1 Tax=Ooceraea biroi TaxID=2015173 RepID=A0A026WYE8_OOCBI|nr:cell growth-regulating nucleolar protein [Ooceraea biroi]EZA60129.1 Cell growth-regulating nucleolar protein [Ooceraea biroi]RLU17762.1 hypothetical protein DMN91_009999 [Ooceraea biroi]
MVVFTCNHCGESLQKPKVAKHYEFRCHRKPFLTCVDCLKDFREGEYVAHTKCITEAERYGGKDYVPKSNANKGERKQQEWICVVSNLLNGTVNLSNEERNFLNTLSRHENIPRKKAKFLNFVRNVTGNRVNAKVVDSVWNKMETMHKGSQESVEQKQDTTQTQKQNNGNATAKFQNEDSNNSLNNQENIIENQNNENICRENSTLTEQNNGNGVCENGSAPEKRKKSKKRKSSDTQVPEEDQPVAKISKTSDSSLQTNNNESDGSPFDWKQNVLDIVRAKNNEISVKKLQGKIVKRYARHISSSHGVHNLTDEEREKATTKFNKALKKLKKSSAICVSEDTVKLV